MPTYFLKCPQLQRNGSFMITFTPNSHHCNHQKNQKTNQNRLLLFLLVSLPAGVSLRLLCTTLIKLSKLFIYLRPLQSRRRPHRGSSFLSFIFLSTVNHTFNRTRVGCLVFLLISCHLSACLSSSCSSVWPRMIPSGCDLSCWQGWLRCDILTLKSGHCGNCKHRSFTCAR